MIIRLENVRPRPIVRGGKVLEYGVHPGTVYNAEIDPGISIRLYGSHKHFPFNMSFKIGDKAEYDLYHMHYIGEIVNITPKTVIIKGVDGKKHRLTTYEFAMRNYNFDLEKILERNQQMSLTI